MIVLIAAVDNNFGLGNQGKLLCHIPEDLSHFKETTKGFPVIMGRKTWESLPKALPGRPNIVLSSQELNLPAGVHQCHYLGEALSLAQKLNPQKQFIIGGGLVYQDSLVLAEEIILTHIKADFTADTFFPSLDPTKWLAHELTPLMTSKTGIKYQIVQYSRIPIFRH